MIITKKQNNDQGTSFLKTSRQIVFVFLTMILFQVSLKAQGQDYFKLGWAAQDKANLDEAIKYYNLAIKQDSTFLSAYIKRGLCYQDLSEFDLALKDFKKANDLKPGDPDIEMSMGTTYFHLKDYKNAKLNLEKALEKMPENSRAQFDLGLTKTELKDYYGALDAYDKAIRLEPKKSQYYYTRAVTKDKLHGFLNALQDCDTAIMLDKKYERAYFLRAKEENELRIYDKALDDLQILIGMNPKNTKYYAEKGDIEYHMGNLNASINDCKTAIRINSYNAEAYYSKALAERDSGLMDSAKADLDQANTLFKKRSPFVWIETAKLYIYNGDYINASEACKQALQIDPKYIYAAYELAYSESYAGQDSGALQILERIVQSDSNFAQAYWLVGRLKLSLGDKSAAMIDFKKGTKSTFDPLGVAFCYAFEGNEKMAVSILNRLIHASDSAGYRIKSRDFYGDLAYVYGVTKNEDKFFECLNKALAAGYVNKGWIYNSPELNYLKSKSAYKELKARYFLN